MIKIIMATAVAATSLAFVTLPAQAQSEMACNASHSIVGRENTISRQLERMGYDVQSVEAWNNCVRAYLVNPDGSLEMAFFQPGSLTRININD
ncbi:PepSY domain-containing protein [Devosia sp. 2618]|uniref:PepSY domain-containing protein n=1 Tax=Devosia sp. 2618 TaxID=3156454 RepID=UPI00339170AB